MRATLLLIMSLVANAASAQPARDVRRPTPGGTARIAGTVKSADPSARPLRRARVMLNGDALDVGRTAIVDDDGRFAFAGLPPGRYTVTAAKEGYITMAYGARRPERPGRSVVVRSGESRSIALQLPRGAVITGSVVDADGEPAPGVTVIALTSRYMAANGERQPVRAALTSVTDDRGIYRIFGLPAGEYVVQGLPRLPAADAQVLSDAEIRQALGALRENATLRSRPGIPASPATLPPPEPRSTVNLAPVFYPGTSIIGRARTIELGPSEERTAIDFQLEYVPTVTVSGTVSEPASITLIPSIGSAIPAGMGRSTRAGADGRFSLSGITPGEYTLTARVYPSGPMLSSAGPPALFKAAQTGIVVNSDDIAGVSLVLEPGLTISGQLVFEGSTSPPPLFPGLRLPMPAYMSFGPLTTVPFPPLTIHEQGRFSVEGIVPGPYRIDTNAPGIRTPFAGWWLQSIVVNGRDVLDRPVELRDNRHDAVVTFSDRASELTGRVADARQNPWVDGYVVVFSTDRDMWFFNSRRVAGARPDNDGRYVVRNLPPGEYFVIAYDDILINEWFDPALLAQLAARAARIRFGEYDKKTYDMIVR